MIPVKSGSSQSWWLGVLVDKSVLLQRLAPLGSHTYLLCSSVMREIHVYGMWHGIFSTKRSLPTRQLCRRDVLFPWLWSLLPASSLLSALSPSPDGAAILLTAIHTLCHRVLTASSSCLTLWPSVIVLFLFSKFPAFFKEQFWFRLALWQLALHRMLENWLSSLIFTCSGGRHPRLALKARHCKLSHF